MSPKRSAELYPCCELHRSAQARHFCNSRWRWHLFFLGQRLPNKIKSVSCSIRANHISNLQSSRKSICFCYWRRLAERRTNHDHSHSDLLPECGHRNQTQSKELILHPHTEHTQTHRQTRNK